MASHSSPPPYHHRAPAPEYRQDNRHGYSTSSVPPLPPPLHSHSHSHSHRNPHETTAMLGLLSLSPKMQATSISLPPIHSLDQPPGHSGEGILLAPIAPPPPRRGYYRPEMDAFENQSERASRSVPHTPVPQYAHAQMSPHPPPPPRVPSAQAVMSNHNHNPNHNPNMIPNHVQASPQSQHAFTPEQQVPRKRKRKSTPPMDQFTPPPSYAHRIINNSYPAVVSIPSNGIPHEHLTKEVMMTPSSSASMVGETHVQYLHAQVPSSSRSPRPVQEIHHTSLPPPPQQQHQHQHMVVTQQSQHGLTPSRQSISTVTPPTRQSASPPPVRDTIRCMCNQDVDYGTFMIACDICETWSHGLCVGIPRDTDAPKKWKCSRCIGEGTSRAKGKEDVGKVAGRKRTVKEKVGEKEKAATAGAVEEGPGAKKKRQRRTTMGIPRTPVTPAGPSQSAPLTPAAGSIPPSESFPPPPLPSSVFPLDKASPITPVVSSSIEQTTPVLDPKSMYGYLPVHEDIVSEDAGQLVSVLRQKLMNTRERRISTALWDENGEDEEMPPVEEDVDVDGSGPPSRDSQSRLHSNPPLPPSSSIPTRIRVHSVPSANVTNQIRPPMFALHSTEDIPANGVISPYVSNVTPTQTYLADPLNAYVSSGIPKPYVRLMEDLSFDARCVGNDSRWARRGCHPNAVLRPILCKKGREEREGGDGEDQAKRQDKTSEKGKEKEKEKEDDAMDVGSPGADGGGMEVEKDADGGTEAEKGIEKEQDGEAPEDMDGKGTGRDKGNAEDDSENEAQVKFALFATQDLKQGDEVVLGWEWDDGHVVHQLPAIIESRYAGMGIRNHRRHRLKATMRAFLHSLASTFQQCACGSHTRDCVINQLAAFAENRESPPPDPVDPHAKPKPQLGSLVGVERGVRVRYGRDGSAQLVSTVNKAIDKKAAAAKLVQNADSDSNLFQRTPSMETMEDDNEQLRILHPRAAGKDLPRTPSDSSGENGVRVQGQQEERPPYSSLNNPQTLPLKSRKMAGKKLLVFSVDTSTSEDGQISPKPRQQQPESSTVTPSASASASSGGVDKVVPTSGMAEQPVATASVSAPPVVDSGTVEDVVTGNEDDMAIDTVEPDSTPSKQPPEQPGSPKASNVPSTPALEAVAEAVVAGSQADNEHEHDTSSAAKMDVDIPTAEQETSVIPQDADHKDHKAVEDMLKPGADHAHRPASTQDTEESGALPIRESSLPHQVEDVAASSIPQPPADNAALASLIFNMPGSRPASPPPAVQAQDPEPIVSDEPEVEMPSAAQVENAVEAQIELTEEKPFGDESGPLVDEPMPLPQLEEHREPSPPPPAPPAPVVPATPVKKITSFSKWRENKKKKAEQASPQAVTHPLPDVHPPDHPPRDTPESPVAKTETLVPSVPPDMSSGSTRQTLTEDSVERVPSEAEKQNGPAPVDHPHSVPDHRDDRVIEKEFEETLHNQEPHTSDCNGLKASSSPNDRSAESEILSETPNAARQVEKHNGHDSTLINHPPQLSPPSTRSSPQSDIRDTTEPTLATPPDDMRVRPPSPTTSESRLKQSNSFSALRSHTTTPAPQTVPHQPLTTHIKNGVKDGTEDGEILLSPPAIRAPMAKPQLPPHPPTQPRALSGRFSSPFTHSSLAQPPLPSHPSHPASAHPLPRFPAASRPPPSAPRAMVGRASSAFPAQPRAPAVDRDREQQQREREREKERERERDRERDRDPPPPSPRDRDFWRERDRDRDRDRNRHLWDRDRDKGRPRGMR